MNTNRTPALDVYDGQKKRMVARISLNGYDIKAGGLLPSTGAMRSFLLVEGDLWESWNSVATLNLRDEVGESVPVRIAALPVETDSYGLLEFL
jgi:hypothetical protein